MKSITTALSALGASLVPAVALACPGSAAHACGSCGSSTTGYMSALGAGILVGIGSVVVEGFLRRKRGSR
jgi:hypothetical protein